MDQNMHLSQYFIGKPHSEYLFPVNYRVWFTNIDRNIRKQIVDRNGGIYDFPGIEYSELLVRELGKREIEPVVRYEARFEKTHGGRFRMVWTVRPDGRYWMDSWGFGGEDYESLVLYSYLDECGRFIAPFRLYSIGMDCVVWP